MGGSRPPWESPPSLLPPFVSAHLMPRGRLTKDPSSTVSVVPRPPEPSVASASPASPPEPTYSSGCSQRLSGGL